MRPRTDTQTRVTTIHFSWSTTHAKCNKISLPTCNMREASVTVSVSFLLTFSVIRGKRRFRVRRSGSEVYIGHGRLCVSVCPSPHSHMYKPGCNLGSGRGYLLVVHYWADLLSVHGFRCYDNTHVSKLIAVYSANAYSAEREMSASACARSMAGSGKAAMFLLCVIFHVTTLGKLFAHTRAV